MNADLKTIQAAFKAKNYQMTLHFWGEMQADYLLFVDLHSALSESSLITDLGADISGNHKFEITGPTTDGREIGIVCAIGESDFVTFITVYQKERQHGS